MKICKACKKLKEFHEFPPAGGNKVGFRAKCIPCYKEYQHNHYMKNHEENKAKNRANKLLRADYYKKWLSDYHKKNRKVNPDKYIDRHLKDRYGISLIEYNNILQKQQGVCAICGKNQTKRRLATDHCHTTGKIRGLLCDPCNKGLGCFTDSIKKLISAAKYLGEEK